MTHIIITFSFLVNSFSFADINPEPTQGRKYAKGDEGFGGIIIYVDPTGEHGVVCAPRDIRGDGKERMVWGCLDATISGARATAMGSGDANTKDIVETCTKGDTAADACRKVKINGYNDWYLPNKGELNAIYKLKKKGKLHLKRSGYWSSTGTGSGNAWVQTFGMGFQFVSAKYGSHRVRPVRKF
ncbi:MAG: hypothetical protein ACJA2S_004642 [Cyclobacteriaceae bacterium]